LAGLLRSRRSRLDLEQVIRELSRNKWMDPKQAIEYGMIDKVGAAGLYLGSRRLIVSYSDVRSGKTACTQPGGRLWSVEQLAHSYSRSHPVPATARAFGPAWTQPAHS
jgi:hypothetical protein